MGYTIAQLNTEFRQPTKDPNITTADLCRWANIALPILLRDLGKNGIVQEHLSFIPRLNLTMTADTWEYDWRTTSKYSATASDTAGVIAVTGPQSTYFLAPGDTATYDGTSYQIIAVSSTSITLDTSVGATSVALTTYADPLYIISGQYLFSGNTYQSDMTRSSEILPPYGRARWDSDVRYHIRGDKLQVSPVPSEADTLTLFYVPRPIKLDSTNSLHLALTNPTQLSDEMNRALVWLAGAQYWLQLESSKEVDRCMAIYRQILTAAGGSGDIGFAV